MRPPGWAEIKWAHADVNSIATTLDFNSFAIISQHIFNGLHWQQDYCGLVEK